VTHPAIQQSTKQSASVRDFRALHESGCFVLPNPWDAGTAIALQQMGYRAVATTSAGAAFSRGLPDDVRAIPRDVMLAHIADVVRATSLPVNADYQNGYADTPMDVATNVALCVATGVAGLSIEDATGDPARPLYSAELAVERVRAAREAIDASKTGVVLTARCEAFLVGDATPFETALSRLVAFADAGADCLFAPGVRDSKQIATIIAAVAPKPVNVIMSAPHPDLTVQKLSELGVRRISVGSALARVAWSAFLSASRSVLETGTFDAFSNLTSFAELNAMFSKG
jgi:2-methylisocitrate lyase-like PEP mutase family enzyme